MEGVSRRRRRRRKGRGEGRVVSMYARAYHPIRSPALGLLNATSVQQQLPRTLGIYLSIYLSIHPFIGR